MPMKDIEVNARWQAAMAECFPTCKRRSPTPVGTGVALWCGGSRRPTMTRDDRGRGRRYDATDEPTAHAVSSRGRGSPDDGRRVGEWREPADHRAERHSRSPGRDPGPEP